MFFFEECQKKEEILAHQALLEKQICNRALMSHNFGTFLAIYL